MSLVRALWLFSVSWHLFSISKPLVSRGFLSYPYVFFFPCCLSSSLGTLHPDFSPTPAPPYLHIRSDHPGRRTNKDPLSGPFHLETLFDLISAAQPLEEVPLYKHHTTFPCPCPQVDFTEPESNWQLLFGSTLLTLWGLSFCTRNPDCSKECGLLGFLLKSLFLN